MRRGYLIAALLLLPILGGAIWPRRVATGDGPVTQIFLGGAVAIPTTAVTRYYFAPGLSGVAWSTTEAPTESIVLAGTISELRVQLSGSVGTGGDSALFRVRHCDPTCAAAADDLTCTITAGNTSCSDLTSSFSVADGDRITIELVTTNTPVGVVPSWSFKWVGSTNNTSMVIGNPNMDGTAVTEYGALYATRTTVAQSVATALAIPAASNFDIVGLWARNLVDLGTTCQRLTLYEFVGGSGSANSAFQVDLTGTPANVSDVTGGPVDWNTGTNADAIVIEIDPGDSCTYPNANAGTNGNMAVTFAVTNASQHFQQGACGVATPSTSAINYIQAQGALGSYNATETLVDHITNGFTQLAFAVRGATPAPDNGAGDQSYTFALRDDTADALGCTVLETATSCNTTGSQVVADGSLVDMESTPSGTPTANTQVCFAWSGTGS